MGKQIMRKYIVALGIRRTVHGVGNCDVVFYLETVEAFNMEDARERAVDMTGGLYDVVFVQRYKPMRVYDPATVEQEVRQRPKKGVRWMEVSKET